MNYSVSETAKLTGVSVRTLHYYDEIGLLSPSLVSETGYRYYDNEALERLQQILFYKELDFPLKAIAEIMKSSEYKKEDALKRQKELLTLKRQRIDRLICLLDANMKGDNTMSFKEFDMSKIEEAKNKYASEAKEKWGNTDAYAQSIQKTNNYSKEDWARATEQSEEIMKKFASYIGTSAENPEIQELVEEWRAYITRCFYDCTKEILAGLGEMYVGDERFMKNIDQFGNGTARLMSEAIQVYCNK